MDIFLDIFDPPPPLWTILLNKAYVVICTYGKPPSPLPCPHGLWMPPHYKCVFYYSKQTLEENNFVSLTRKSRRRSLVTNGGHCPNSKQTMMPKRRGEKRQQNEPKETIEKERANEPELQIFIIIRYSWTRQKPIHTYIEG